MESKKLKFKDNFKYILFWPAYIACFVGAEMIDYGQRFHLVHCFLDDMIPFHEIFVIPYLSWHPLIAITLIYTLVNETDNFRNLMKFFILTFMVTMVIYLVYPTCLNIRPVSFERDNFLVDVVKFVYYVDTPQNVCPSLHIIGSLGLLFASWDTRGKDSIPKKVFMALAVAFICISTLVMKQHSVIDVCVAIPISFIGWLICFRGKEIDKIRDIDLG